MKYTVTQLERLYRKAWDRMTEGNGYQPWGYDAVTIRLTSPGWYRTLKAISNAHQVALKHGKAEILGVSQ